MDVLQENNNSINLKTKVLVGLFSVYGTVVTTGSRAYSLFIDSPQMINNIMSIMVLTLCLIITFLLFYVGTCFIHNRIKMLNWKIISTGDKIDKKVFVIVSLVFFFILFFQYLKYYPGGISPDSIVQWNEAQTFDFNNWHPVFHTILIWLVSRIINSVAFVIFIQVVLFSIAFSILYITLFSFGVPKLWLNIMFLIILLNPCTSPIVLYLWKDSALALFLLFALTCLVKIVLTNGFWLNKLISVVGFSILLAAATMLRHNAFFFTVPFIVLISIAYFKNKNVKLMIPIFIVVLLLIRFPLYSSLSVTYPDNTFDESIGVPMTIITSVYKVNPSAISPETKDFLLSLAPQSVYDENEYFGYYNIVKMKFTQTPSEVTTPMSLIKMTIDTIREDSKTSLFAVLSLTKFVWDATGTHFYYYVPSIYDADNMINPPIPNEELQEIGHVLDLPIQVAWAPVGAVFACIGFYLLLILFGSVITFSYIGWRSFLITLPMMCYVIGTMLLLCGNDFRFFYFCTLLAAPSTLLMIAKCKQIEGVERE